MSLPGLRRKLFKKGWIYFKTAKHVQKDWYVYIYIHILYIYMYISMQTIVDMSMCKSIRNQIANWIKSSIKLTFNELLLMSYMNLQWTASDSYNQFVECQNLNPFQPPKCRAELLEKPTGKGRCLPSILPHQPGNDTVTVSRVENSNFLGEMPQWVGPQWICSRRPCRLSMPSIIKECLASPPAPWVQGSNVGRFVKCPQKIYKNHMADLYLLQGLLFFAQYCSISSQPRWT